MNLNLISSFLHLTTTKTKVVIYDKFNNLVEIPYKWIDDIKAPTKLALEKKKLQPPALIVLIIAI